MSFDKRAAIEVIKEIGHHGVFTVYDSSNDDSDSLVVVLNNKKAYEIWTNEHNPTINTYEVTKDIDNE